MSISETIDADEVAAMSPAAAAVAVAQVRRRLDVVHGELRKMHTAPTRRFDFERDVALREAVGQPPHLALVALVRAAEKFERWLADPATWPATKFSEDTAAACGASAAGATQAFRFNALAFIANIRSRGLSIAAVRDRVIITPRAGLNATDRSILTNAEKRQALIRALRDTEEF